MNWTSKGPSQRDSSAPLAEETPLEDRNVWERGMTKSSVVAEKRRSLKPRWWRPNVLEQVRDCGGCLLAVWGAGQVT